MMNVVKTASTTHPIQTFKQPNDIFWPRKSLTNFLMGRNVLFIHFSGEIKDLSLERIRGFAHCRTSLFPRPSALHYELENDATAEKSMHTDLYIALSV